MRYLFLISFSYVLHPLFIPTYTTILFYQFSPRFIDKPLIIKTLLVVIGLTIGVPLLIYVMLKKLGYVASIHLKTTKERIVPLIIQATLLYLIVVITGNNPKHTELSIFFLGSAFSALIACILAIKRIKASLHMISVSAPLIFCMILSLVFQLNMLIGVILGIALIALTAVSRLIMKAHSLRELIYGVFIGILPQILCSLFYRM